MPNWTAEEDARLTAMWVNDETVSAAEKVAALLALPLPETSSDGTILQNMGEYFDPWTLFPCVYGTYSSDFDDLAIAVLTDVRDRTWICEGLAQEMFREMLCVAELCDYGTSPCACFATSQFAGLLPALVEKWTQYRNIVWGEG